MRMYIIRGRGCYCAHAHEPPLSKPWIRHRLGHVPWSMPPFSQTTGVTVLKEQASLILQLLRIHSMMLCHVNDCALHAKMTMNMHERHITLIFEDAASTKLMSGKVPVSHASLQESSAVH